MSDSESKQLSENEYYVEKVIDKKVVDGEVRYLIKWEGWPEDESTWEPVENLDHIQNLIADFERERNLYSKPRGRPPKKGNTNNFSKEEKHEKSEKYEKHEKYEKNEKYEKSVKSNSNDKKEEIQTVTNLGINVPDTLTSVKKDLNGEIICLCRFKERPDGITPDDAYVPSKILKELYPKVLISFYESKIKFVDKK